MNHSVVLRDHNHTLLAINRVQWEESAYLMQHGDASWSNTQQAGVNTSTTQRPCWSSSNESHAHFFPVHLNAFFVKSVSTLGWPHATVVHGHRFASNSTHGKKIYIWSLVLEKVTHLQARTKQSARSHGIATCRQNVGRGYNANLVRQVGKQDKSSPHIVQGDYVPSPIHPRLLRILKLDFETRWEQQGILHLGVWNQGCSFRQYVIMRRNRQK